MSDSELAQFNLAILRAPLDAALMSEFAALLDPVNALADASPGFVWRHRPAAGAAEVRHRDNLDQLILNLSVWKDVASLQAYVYSGAHLEVMRRRAEWLQRVAKGSMVLWWIQAGARPSLDDGLARLDMLRDRGPTSDAFSFRSVFPAPNFSPAPVNQ